MDTQQPWQEKFQEKYRFGVYSPELNRIDDDVMSFISDELDAQRAWIVEEIKYRVPEEFRKHYKGIDADTLAADIVAKLIHGL